jgi:phosphonate transport system permease protein
MVRPSLYIPAVAIAALLLSDISISTLDPWVELGRMARGLLSPRIYDTSELIPALFNTVSFNAGSSPM